jgi:hypothetical protein
VTSKSKEITMPPLAVHTEELLKSTDRLHVRTERLFDSTERLRTRAKSLESSTARLRAKTARLADEIKTGPTAHADSRKASDVPRVTGDERAGDALPARKGDTTDE